MTYLVTQLVRAPTGRLLEVIWYRVTGRDLYHNSREILLRAVVSDDPEELDQRLDGPLVVDGVTVVQPEDER